MVPQNWDPHYIAAPTVATYAAFGKERRMKFANATNLNRKSGVARSRDLLFLFRTGLMFGAAALGADAVSLRAPVGRAYRLIYTQDLICPDVSQRLDDPAGPIDLDRLCHGIRAHAKVNPLVAGR
jgi:hypothetical protein